MIILFTIVCPSFFTVFIFCRNKSLIDTDDQPYQNYRSYLPVQLLTELANRIAIVLELIGMMMIIIIIIIIITIKKLL